VVGPLDVRVFVSYDRWALPKAVLLGVTDRSAEDAMRRQGVASLLASRWSPKASRAYAFQQCGGARVTLPDELASHLASGLQERATCQAFSAMMS